MLCAPIAGLGSGLRFILEKVKEKGKEPPYLPSLHSCQDSAQHSAAVNLSFPRLVWSSGAVVSPSHRLTHSPMSDRTVPPLAPSIGSPMAVGDLAFASLIPQVSLQASSQGKEVGEQASLDALVLSVARFFDVSSRLDGLLHRVLRPLKDERNGDPRLLGSKRAQLLIAENGKRVGSGMHSTS
jgi:hypothetical protein